MTKVTALAVENLDLLHRLDARPEGDETTSAELARELGRDKSNFAKTLGRLRDEGVVGDGIALTDAGRAVTRVLSPDGELRVSGENVLRYVGELQPEPNNERKHFEPGAVTEMKLSLITHGQLQDLVIRAGPPGEPDYIVVGETRWRGASEGVAEGIWTEPLRCRLVTETDARRLTWMRLAENLHRTNLHRLDEGAGYLRMRDEFGMDAHTIAASLQGRRTPKHIADHIALVEKLPEPDQARMYLSDDDPNHLRYVDARKLIQGQNAKPKPAIDLEPKEALVLLEVITRFYKQPSHDSLAHGADGWTRAPLGIPAGGAAMTLVGKGLIEFCEAEIGTHAYVRTHPDRATEIRLWAGERSDAMSLWHVRAEAVGSGIAADLEASGRYATPWLNDPLSEPEPTPASSPEEPASTPPPPAEAGEGDHEVVEGAQPLAPWEARLIGAPVPAQAAPELQLTDVELGILADIAAKIAVERVAGRAGGDGKPAFHGCTMRPDYYKDARAQPLVQAHRLICFVPSARDVQMCAFTPRGRAWLEANPQPPRKPPYATPWLNPPEPEAKEPLVPVLPPGDTVAFVYAAIPLIEPPTEFRCGNCEREFEISAEIDEADLPNCDALESRIFTPPRAAANCPNCQAPVRLMCAEVHIIKWPEET